VNTSRRTTPTQTTDAMPTTIVTQTCQAGGERSRQPEQHREVFTVE